jgi:arylsulfatase A-like enzyme
MPAALFPGTFLLQVRNSLLFDAVDGFMVNVVLRNFSWISSRLNHEVWVEPRAVFAAAQHFIRGAPAPYFLWIHLYPPHFPYLTEPPFSGRFLSGGAYTTLTECFWKTPPPAYPPAMQSAVNLLRLRYDERIFECDTALGEFLEWMAAGGRDANTILIVTSDHGERFSSGWWSHESPDVHYAETHIPLLISMPAQNRTCTENADGDLTDVAPTILAAVGIETPAWMDGHSLIGAAAAKSPEPSYSMYLAESSVFRPPSFGTIAANSGPYRLVWHFYNGAGTAKLFDVADDPDESRAVNRPDKTMELFAAIQQRFGRALKRCPGGSQ